MVIRFTDKEKLKSLFSLRNRYRKDSSEWKNINDAIRTRVYASPSYDSEEEKVFDITEFLLVHEDTFSEINDRIVDKIGYLYDSHPSDWRRLTKTLFCSD